MSLDNANMVTRMTLGRMHGRQIHVQEQIGQSESLRDRIMVRSQHYSILLFPEILFIFSNALFIFSLASIKFHVKCCYLNVVNIKSL